MRSILPYSLALLQRNTKFYLVPVLLIAYIFTQRSQQLTWPVFLGLIGSLLLLSIPILLWSWWSETKSPPRRTFWGAWMATFVLYPSLLIVILGLKLPYLQFVREGNLSQTWAGGSIFVFFFIAQFLLSLALIASESWRERPRLSPIADWNIQRLAIIILALFAFGIVLVSNYFQEAVRTLEFGTKVVIYLWTVLQVFIIYSTYYVVYYVHHHWLFNRLLRQGGLLHYALGAIGFLLFLCRYKIYLSRYFRPYINTKFIRWEWCQSS